MVIKCILLVLMLDLVGVKIQETKPYTYIFSQQKSTFDLLIFLKLSVHVFCLAEKAKNCRINFQQNKMTVRY